MTPEDVVGIQNGIIKLQADVINELFLLLGQHVAAEELDGLPVVDKINLAAELRSGLAEEVRGCHERTHENEFNIRCFA